MFLLLRIEEDINYHVCELNCDLKLSAVITFHACEYLKLSMRVSIRWFILWVLKFVPLWRFLQKDEHVKSETSIIHWQLARRRAIWKSVRIYRKQLFCKGCRFFYHIVKKVVEHRPTPTPSFWTFGGNVLKDLYSPSLTSPLSPPSPPWSHRLHHPLSPPSPLSPLSTSSPPSSCHPVSHVTHITSVTPSTPSKPLLK